MRERHDAGPRIDTESSDALEHVDDRILQAMRITGGMLRLDRHPQRSRPGVGDVDERVQRHDPIGLAVVHVPTVRVPMRIELGEAHAAHGATTGRRAVDEGIVHEHQVTIAGEPHIALEGISAFTHRQLIGLAGVFGLRMARAPMGHHQCHDRLLSESLTVNNTPGFSRSRGSHARLIARIAAISLSERDVLNHCVFARPMPCSADTAPP